MASSQHGRSLLLLASLLGLLLLSTMPASIDAKKPKKLHFFLLIIPQNLSDLNNPKAQYNAVRTGAPAVPQNFTFGVLNTFDNPISKRASLADPADVVGRVQGWYGDCGQDYLALCLSQTFTYADGVFNGTFSLIGVSVAAAHYKEAAIVGGTGDFAFCRGIAGQHHSFNETINNEEHSWFKYNVTFKC